jgi:hypothetical protein
MFTKNSGKEASLTQKARALQDRCLVGDEKMKSSLAVQQVSKDYLDELMREINQIEAGVAYGKGKGDQKRKEERLKEIGREINKIEELNTGIKTPEQLKGWWPKTIDFSKKAGGNLAVLGAAVGVGIFAALALSNPLGLGLVGVIAIGAFVAVLSIAIFKFCSSMRTSFSSNPDQVMSAAQKDLGLDAAAQKELVSGRSIEMTAMSSTTSTAKVPKVQSSPGANVLSPGAEAAQSSRSRNRNH